MNARHFDALFMSLITATSRRAALRLMGGLGLAGPFGRVKARKQRKKKCAKAGLTTSKKRKKCCSGLAEDASGRCAAPIVSSPGCVPGSCPASTCGNSPDGCGGTLNCGGCVGDAICVSGVCQPCAVSCPVGATDCAAALETTMAGGGTIYVCPGLYQGNIDVGQSVTVIGAGQGNDPASNTIVQGTGTRSVVRILPGTVATVTFQNLRITGGRGGPGSGIQNGDGQILSLIDCTITDNHGGSSAGEGGGIYTGTGSRLSPTGCTITGNSASNSGGGIKNLKGGVTLINTTISGNSTTPTGGGIDTVGGTLTLDVASRVTGNEASMSNPDSGGGIYSKGSAVTLGGFENITNNTPDNCGGDAVPLCVA